MKDNNYSLSTDVIKDYVREELFSQLGLEEYLLPEQCDQQLVPYNGQQLQNGEYHQYNPQKSDD